MSTDIQKVLNEINKVEEYLEKYPKETKECELVLVLGNTGSGKSTLVNFLCGCEMVAVPDNTTGDILLDCVNPKVAIGHGAISSSRFPSFAKTGGTKPLNFCDFPGFFDNRGLEYDISSMFGVASLAKSARRLKGIILVIAYSSLQADRGKCVRDAVDMMSMMFGENWQSTSVLSSVLLVISGADTRLSTLQLRTKLKAISETEYLLPTYLIDRAVAYDPILIDPIAHSRISRGELCKRIRDFPGISDKSPIHFSLSRDAVLTLVGIMSDLSYEAKAKWSENCFKEVNSLIKKMDQVALLSCSEANDVRESFDSFMAKEVLCICSKENVSEDDKTMIEAIGQEIAGLRSLTDNCVQRIEATLDMRDEVRNLQQKLEALKVEDNVNRQSEEACPLAYSSSPSARPVRPVTQAAIPSTAPLVPPPYIPMNLPLPPQLGFSPYNNYNHKFQGMNGFSYSSTSSVSSTRTRFSSDWDSFRSANKGRGLTRYQMSAKYHAWKRGSA